MRETIRLWIRQAVQWAWAHPKLALWGGLSGILYFLLRGTVENIFFDGIKWLLYTSFGWLIDVGDVIAIAWFISTVALPIGLAGVIIYGAYLLGRQPESPARRDLPNAAPAPDMTIWQAIHYLAMKSQWSYEPRGQAETHALLDDALRACSITAWGQRCLTPIESMREAASKEPPAIQLSGHEERIPCAEWAHMKIAPCWIGYAEFPHDEYPSARTPHLTFPRGDKWVHCYGHLRVSSNEIKRLWPPRIVGGSTAADVSVTRSITVIDLAIIARDQFGWKFTPETFEFMDFQNGLRRCHKEKRFVIQGLKGCIGSSVPQVFFQTRVPDDIPADHFERHWIYADEFVATGNEDNTLVHTDHPGAVSPIRDRYGDLRIRNRDGALAWLRDAGHLRGQYKQAQERDQAKREERDRKLKEEEAE